MVHPIQGPCEKSLRGAPHEKTPHPPKEQDDSDDDSGKLQNGDLVPLLRHPSQPSSASLQGGGEIREDLILDTNSAGLQPI